MNPNIENVKKYIPPNNTGYQYVKHAIVYVPVKEVGLEILERQRQQISFLYETILKFLKHGITDIDQNARLLGLEMDVYKEIISQMDSDNLLFVSDSNISITNKGTQALTELKKVSINKSYLNQVYINMVTGKIFDDEPHRLYKTPRPSCMCLDQTLSIDLDYFRKQIEQIDRLYRRNTIDELVFRTNPEDKELYRLLNIDYENTMFIEISCFVFIHPESGEILLSFEGDKDSQYLSAAMAQIRGGLTGAMKIFDTINSDDTAVLKIDETKQSALNNLINLLEQREKTKISTQEIEEAYYTSRYLLSGEVEEIVTDCSYFKPKTIFIESPSIKVLLDSPSIVSAITSSSIERLVLIYNEKEYNVNRSIDWLMKSTQNAKLRMECYPQIQESPVMSNHIIAEHSFCISTYLEQLSINYGKKMVFKKELSDITFDDSAISEELNKLYKLYKISDSAANV